MKALYKFLLISMLIVNSSNSFAYLFQTKERFPLYVGGLVGYGNTDWNQIGNDQDEIVADNSLFEAKDDGVDWGIVAGYQFNKLFAMEGSFTRYARTTVHLTEYTAYDVPEPHRFKSSTETYLLIFKVMVPFALEDRLNFMVDVGFGSIHRSDVLRTTSRFAPTFGAGFIYNTTPRWFNEVSFEYTPGYGKATETPLMDYIPFVYSIHYKFGIRFPVTFQY